MSLTPEGKSEFVQKIYDAAYNIDEPENSPAEKVLHEIADIIIPVLLPYRSEREQKILSRIYDYFDTGE